MRIKCTLNYVAGLEPGSDLRRACKAWFPDEGKRLDLTIGGDYTVYAISNKQSSAWFFIADDNYQVLQYPIAYPAAFFEVVDDRLSRSWRYCDDALQRHQVFLSFDEWWTHKDFFELLVAGEKPEQKIFNTRKRYMDMEFVPGNLKLTALHLEENWFQCPKCAETWDDSSPLATVQCVGCRIILINQAFECPD